MNPQEIESYFAYDGTYLDATVHGYTSKWRFSVAWEHIELRETITPDNIPTDEPTLQQMAIERYESHKWRNALRNMDSDKQV